MEQRKNTVAVVCGMISQLPRPVHSLLCTSFVLCVLFGAQRGLAQPVMARVDIDTYGFTEPGYYIIAPLQQDTLAVVDEYARPLLHRRVGLHTNAAVYGQKYLTHFGGSRRARYFVRRDFSLQPIDTFAVSEPGLTDFHEGKVWTDTSMMILGFEQTQMDLSKVVPGGQTNATVIVGIIEEQTFDGRVVFRWKSTDHVPLDQATPDIDLTQNYIDYIHINSISRQPNGDLLVSCRHTDQVLCINRETGAVRWRLGGSMARGNDFRFLNDTTNGFVGFSHQHTAFRTARGTLMMFDNGNLKPEPQRSRVVEYEVDETAMTVRAVRSIIPDSVGFVRSMGNVEELPGGNILVGYGNESGRVLAHEIDPAGRIVATIRNTNNAPIDPYRVIKARIGMTAHLDTIDAAGQYRFANADSATGLTIIARKLTSPVVVSAERHHTPPPQVLFDGSAPEHVLPMRWVLRYSDGEAQATSEGETLFDLAVLPKAPAGSVRLYARDSVGRGPFSPLIGVYDRTANTFLCPRIVEGEVVAVLDSLNPPEMVQPTSQTQNQSPEAASVVLRMPAVGVDAVVSAWPESEPARAITRTVRRRPDGLAVLVLEDLVPDRMYRWSAISIGSQGAQSAPITWSSRTLPVADERIITTRPNGDTAAYNGSVELYWTPTRPEDKTLLQLTTPIRGPLIGIDLSMTEIDTIAPLQGMLRRNGLQTGTSYFWRVLQLDETSSTKWSALQGFSTPAEAGQALMPVMPPNGTTQRASAARLTFTTSDEYRDYVVQVRQQRSDGSYAEAISIVADPAGEVLLTDLREGSAYFWRVIGTGSDSDTGCVFMFRVEGASSAADVPATASTVRCQDGLITIEADDVITGVSVVDLSGRLRSLDVGHDIRSLQRPLVMSLTGWIGVVVRLANGQSSFHPAICR
ncbi:MAG TPA: hypothetical protein DCZ59_10240 [Bacteroidetes bacterium]|nr:hypothetical protein [Bacteroidota bacterium]